MALVYCPYFLIRYLQPCRYRCLFNVIAVWLRDGLRTEEEADKVDSAVDDQTAAGDGAEDTVALDDDDDADADDDDDDEKSSIHGSLMSASQDSGIKSVNFTYLYHSQPVAVLTPPPCWGSGRQGSPKGNQSPKIVGRVFKYAVMGKNSTYSY